MMRRACGAAVVFIVTACGGHIDGTAAAPAGTIVLVYEARVADEYVRTVQEHDRPLIAAIALSQRSGDSGQRAVRMVDSVLSAPRGGQTGESVAIGQGTVGVGGVLAMNGRYRGRLALVLEPSAQLPAGCRVDVAMPIYGDRLVTLAGRQCSVWPEPIEANLLRRELATKWSEDSLAHEARAREDSASRAKNAAMLSWPYIAERDGVYYFTAASPCARKIPMNRRIYLRDPVHAHANGYARSEDPAC